MSNIFKTVYTKGNIFKIDASKNKVAINKSSPDESLDVSGNIKFSGEIIGNIKLNTLSDIKDVSFNKNDLSDGKILKWNAQSNFWELAEDGGGNSGGTGTGSGTASGVTIVPLNTPNTDLSGNTSYPNSHSGTGKEGDIIYDVSKNKFYEASNSKEDGQAGGEVKFRELGYSFFSEHMEGQPPAPSFFFFSITPSSIKINWTNPIQYHSGVSNSNDPYNNTNNGEFSSTVNSNSNIYFPVVNRIMIQIYNKQTQSYETWGNKRSPITSDTAISGGVEGLKNGYVLCSKNYPIPPIGSQISPYFGTRNAIGRNVKVYELKDFADSIILYKKDNTPENSTIQPTIQNNKLVSSVKEESNVKELNISSSGYEIKLWLENQYDSGTMSVNDFNVVTLTQDNNGNDINFQTVDPPTKPISVETKIAFNDLGKVSDGKTYIELAVKDPKNTSQSSSGDFNNINLTRIKIQYANLEDSTAITESSWNNISKIYWNNTNNYTSNSPSFQNKLLSSSNFNNGIHIIDRVNDHSSVNSSDTNTIRYYYIKIDSQFLSTITNYNVKSKFIFRVSYKNASNDNFGLFQQSNIISINKPNKPSISLVRMTSYNTLTITLASFNDKEDIIGDTTSIINNNMGVFLRNIKFQVSYKYNNNSFLLPSSIFSFEGGIFGGENSKTNTYTNSIYINTTNFTNSTYNYILPEGLFPSSNVYTEPIIYYFKISIQNNLIDDYSDFSEEQSIQISKPNSNMNITFIPQTSLTSSSNSNYNNKIQATLKPPSDGNRGIVSAQTESGLPKLQKYTFQSDNLKKIDSNSAIEHTNTSNTSGRDEDPSTQIMLTFYDALKYSAGASMPVELNLKVREYNEYVNNYTEVSKTIEANAVKPEIVTIISHADLVISPTTTSKNTVTLNWSHPTIRGLTIGGNNIRNTILTYTINIERTATTNNYLIGNSDQTDVTYETTTTQTDNSNYKTGIADATNTKTLTSYNDNSLLWPNSTYSYTVRATNSLGYQSDAQTAKGTFTTDPPTIPDAFNYFSDSRLSSLRNNYDLKDNNNYQNLGVLVSGGVTSSTTYSGTAVQITNYNNLSDITSNTVTHVLNKKHLQEFTNTLSNSDVQSWSSSVPTTANQAGFKIVNAADSDTVLYTIGMSSNYNYNYETNDDTVFQVLRTNRKDIYSETYDDRNRGYWLKETIQYNINLATENNLSAYLYKPLKLELKSFYNEDGSGTISASQTGETIILQNSYSSNGGNIYLDVLNSSPSIVKNSTNNMITYTPSNQINGIPNLARGGTIVLKYKLENYSQFYLLNSSLNVSEHYFSYSNTVNDPISWASKDDGTRNSNHWIVDKTLNSIPSTNTATSTITIKIKGRNTKGISDLTIGSSDSVVYNFIYDKPSSDGFTSIESSLIEIPSNFNPVYGAVDNQTEFQGEAYAAKDQTVNILQLSLWNNYFYGSDGWRNATSITTDNCANYGMASTLPVFSTGSDYKWVIFKYTGSAPSTSDYNYYTVIAQFSDSDFDYNNVVNEDIVVYFYNKGSTTPGNDGKNYYWLNISGKSTIGASQASNGAITTTGTVGISTQGANSSDFESNSYSKLGITGPRILGGWLNSDTIDKGTSKLFYLAVGIKNTITSGVNYVKIRKPVINLAQNNDGHQELS